VKNDDADLQKLPLPPGNRAFPLLGETLAFLKDSFAFVARRVERHGPVFRTHLLGKTTVVFAGPSVSSAFLDTACVAREGSMPPHVQELFGGQSLPLLDGEVHRARKEQVLAAFVREAMPGYLPAMQEILEGALAAWTAKGEIRGLDELKRVAIAVIARNMVGLRDGEDLEALLAGLGAVTGGFAGVPIPLPGTAYKRGLNGRDVILAILRRLTAEHRAAPREDGLGRMLAFVGSDGETLADDDAVREMHHVFLAGYIVFAELAGLLQRLEERPDLRDRVRAEVQAISPSGPLTVRALASMPTLGRVVLETKRITPVVPVSFGRAIRTFEVSGYRVPAGTMLFWAPWSHDQDAATFPEPTRFDEGRFGDAEVSRRTPDAFAPQGMGRAAGHLCAGVDYSTLLMQAFAAIVLREHAWSFPEQDLTIDAGRIPPEHRDGLRVVFHRERDPKAARPEPSGAAVRAAAEGAEVALPALGHEALLALASVIWADGVFADEEATALVRIARASGLDDDAVRAVEAATRGRTAPSAAPLDLDRPTAEHLYALACLVAASDGSVDPRERVAVEALGDRLSLDEAARARASVASHAVAVALGAPHAALGALAAELERATD
jgi:cytochrome P450/tellurite resistance protein